MYPSNIYQVCSTRVVVPAKNNPKKKQPEKREKKKMRKLSVYLYSVPKES